LYNDAMPTTSAHARNQLQFCRALDQECGGKLLRHALIAKVARRLGLEEAAAIVLAADCAAGGLVQLDVKGPPYRSPPASAMLREEGRRAIVKRSR